MDNSEGETCEMCNEGEVEFMTENGRALCGGCYDMIRFERANALDESGF